MGLVFREMFARLAPSLPFRFLSFFNISPGPLGATFPLYGFFGFVCIYRFLLSCHLACHYRRLYCASAFILRPILPSCRPAVLPGSLAPQLFSSHLCISFVFLQPQTFRSFRPLMCRPTSPYRRAERAWPRTKDLGLRAVMIDNLLR